MISTSKSRPRRQRKGRTGGHNSSNRHRHSCQTNTSGSATPHSEPLPTSSPFSNPRPKPPRTRKLRQREHDPPGPRSLPAPRSVARNDAGGAGLPPPRTDAAARLGSQRTRLSPPPRPCPALRGPKVRWATRGLGPARHRPGASVAAPASERQPGRRVRVRVKAPLPPCPEAGAAPRPPSYRARPGPLRRTNAGPPPPPPGRRRAGLARAALAANQRAGSGREHATAERSWGSAEAAGVAMAGGGP